MTDRLRTMADRQVEAVGVDDDVDRQLILVATRLYLPSIGGAVVIAPLIAALAWPRDRSRPG